MCGFVVCVFYICSAEIKSHSWFCSRSSPQRCSCRCGGGCNNLRPAGGGVLFPAQEEPGSFPGPPFAPRRLLQADRLSGDGVGRKRSDHRPGDSLRRITAKVFSPGRLSEQVGYKRFAAPRSGAGGGADINAADRRWFVFVCFLTPNEAGSGSLRFK